MRLDSVLFDGGGGIAESDARALAVHDAVADTLASHTAEQRRRLLMGLGAGAVTFVLGILVFVAGVTTLGGVVLGILGLAVAGGGWVYVSRAAPEVTVTGIEKGYWTGHAVPTDDGTVLFDATETAANREFELEMLSSPDRIRSASERLRDIGDFPVLLTEADDVEAEFLDVIGTVDAEIDRADTERVAAPLVDAQSTVAESLTRLTEQADREPIDAGGVSLSVADAVETVDRLDEFEAMAADDSDESVLRSVDAESRAVVTELSGLQKTAVDLLNDHVQSAGDLFAIVTYNFYCPSCLTDDVESELELLADDDGNWFCDTCRTRFDEEVVIPRHKIRDDVVSDVWDTLWVEKDDQRREIYENIEDQKADLREREFEQRREEIRTVSERIKDVRARIRDLKTEAKAKQGTVSEIGDLMVKYERLNERRKEEFEDDVTEAYERIDAETEEALEETQNIEQERLEEAEQAAEEKAELLREEERIREQERIAFEQAMENRRLQAQMEHEAALTQATLEQSAHHHTEELLIETRGGTHAFDTVNRFADWKGETFGRSKYEGGR